MITTEKEEPKKIDEFCFRCAKAILEDEGRYRIWGVVLCEICKEAYPQASQVIL